MIVESAVCLKGLWKAFAAKQGDQRIRPQGHQLVSESEK
jgi:hypothetical protein